jgi:hypothetical protein
MKPIFSAPSRVLVAPLMLAALSLGLGACAAPRRPSTAISELPLARVAQADAVPRAVNDVASPTPASHEAVGQRPGDYWVMEVEQVNAAKKAVRVRLTQRVLDDHTLEYVFQEGGQVSVFRSDLTGGNVRQVLSGIEHEGAEAAFERAMGKTVPAVEQNDGLVSEHPEHVLVGNFGADARTSRFAVKMFGKPHTMSVTSSSTFPMADVRGEISDAGGKVVYSARLVEVGRAAPGSGHDTSTARK